MSVELPVYILDSYALLAYFEGEPAASRVKSVLHEAQQQHCTAVVSWINLGEIVYITERERGLAQAQKLLAAVEQLPVELLEATSERVLAAAHIKAHFTISYADAFAVAAAQERQGLVLTGDPEFQAVKHLVQVEWLP